MNDFLNPKSMRTPGVAGSLMMFLVNGLASQFPELPARYLALCLSFLLGSIVILLFYPLVDRILKTLSGVSIGGGF